MSWYEDGLRFACRRCGNCCTGKGTYVDVGPQEIAALARATAMTPEDFRERHTITRHGKTVLLDTGDAGDCEWLVRDEDGGSTCRVHAATPDQCRSYPFWPRLLRTRTAWEAEGATCRGIGQGEVIAADEVARRAGVERAFEDLDELLEDLVHEVEGVGVQCRLRGDCCDFPTAGHRLYATRLEAERFARNLDLSGWDPDSGLCPAWKDRRCTAREQRPLACRTFFCDPAFTDAVQDLTERSITRLKGLHDKHRIPWDYRDWIAHLAALREESYTPEA